MQFDLSQVDADGDVVARPDLGGQINRIDCHMPRGSLGVAWEVRQRATRAALAAAHVCGWRIYDPQLDQHLDDYTHRCSHGLPGSLGQLPDGSWLLLTDGAHDHDDAFEELRFGWITDARCYAECFDRSNLPGQRHRRLWSRVFGASLA